MITKEEVRRISKLARLELNPEEMRKMQKDLSAIIDYFKTLEEIGDSKAESDFFSSNGLELNARKDIPKSEDREIVEKMLEQAPAKEKKMLKVREILK